jgi:hypothetical protein
MDRSRPRLLKVEQVQYYHRAVACQIVSSPAKPFLAIEWLQPGEGEDTAALRLLEKLPDLYGSRSFDILLLDALLAQAPVLKLAERIGWDRVISLKQNHRNLYQSANRPIGCSRAAPLIPAAPNGRMAKPMSSSSEIQMDYQFPLITRNRYGSCGPRRSLLKIIIDASSLHRKLPSTNGSGLLLWTGRHFPLPWCAASDMIAGSRRTMAGTI